MKSSVLLFFAAGLLAASAIPADQQTTPHQSNDSETVNSQTIPNKATEQSEQNTNTDDIATIKNSADNVDVVIEEIIDVDPFQELIQPEEDTAYLGDESAVSMVDQNNLYRNALVDFEEEMMETAQSSSIAAGFSLRKRNRKKNRKPQQPARRRQNHYRRNPFSYRRLSYPYYYPYYFGAFYRPRRYYY